MALVDDFLPSLIRDLRYRLDEIEAERAAIAGALHALEGPKRRRSRRDLCAALVDALAASPGSRASFLALEFGVCAATVTDDLLRLERNGEVVKRGLGWELVPKQP